MRFSPGWEAGDAMPNSPRWLVIGLDGASYNLIDPLIERGCLPNLLRLMRGGAHGRLISTVPWQTPVAWTSYATGVNPGAHGVYGWWVSDARDSELRTSSGRQVDPPRFWDVLSSAGIRVGVVNVPMSYPARPVNGFVICGFDGPFETMEADPLVSYPAGLLPELQAGGLHYRILADRNTDEPLEAAARNWAEIERVRAASVVRLVERFRPEFLQVNLFLTDYFAHRSRVGDPALDIAYGAADEVVGMLCGLADTDTCVLIVSDHGSQPINKFVLIHQWLQELGLLAFHPWLADEHVECVTGNDPAAAAALLGRMRREGPPLREQLWKKVRRHAPGANIGFSTIDWDRTKAFCSSDYGQITLNRVRGRGAVPDEREACAVLDTLTRAFRALEDPDTGVALVDEVIPRRELYHGAFALAGPDLTPVLRDHSYYFCQVYSFYRRGAPGVMCAVEDLVDPVATGSIGDHHPHGILVAHGLNITPGVLADASILDVAPTLLESFGVPPLPHHEGVHLRDLFGGVRDVAARPRAAEQAGPEALKRRLITLGYRI
jgi:predicted AlkP superfamily phosphohydrolase/phosphomutase